MLPSFHSSYCILWHFLLSLLLSICTFFCSRFFPGILPSFTVFPYFSFHSWFCFLSRLCSTVVPILSRLVFPPSGYKNPIPSPHPEQGGSPGGTLGLEGGKERSSLIALLEILAWHIKKPEVTPTKENKARFPYSENGKEGFSFSKEKGISSIKKLETIFFRSKNCKWFLKRKKRKKQKLSFKEDNKFTAPCSGFMETTKKAGFLYIYA